MSSRLKDDPRQYEKETFVDRINEIHFIIKEFRKLHEKMPVTDHLLCARSLRNFQKFKSNMRLSGVLDSTCFDILCRTILLISSLHL